MASSNPTAIAWRIFPCLRGRSRCQRWIGYVKDVDIAQSGRGSHDIPLVSHNLAFHDNITNVLDSSLRVCDLRPISS
jgi:hypothetical protein